MKIDTLVGIDNYTLVIYYYPTGFYQSWVFCPSVQMTLRRNIHSDNFNSIFLNAQDAYERGKNAIKLAFDFDVNKNKS